MTLQEAIQILEVAKAECEWNAPLEYQAAIDVAIEALDKQIPKKLIAESDGYADGSMVYDIFYCPSCDHRLEEDEVEDYCPNCGQKICWEGE